MKLDFTRVDVYELRWPSIMFTLNELGAGKVGEVVARWESQLICGHPDRLSLYYELPRPQNGAVTVRLINRRTGQVLAGIKQEPISNGAWWVKVGNHPWAGPYTWEQVRDWEWATPSL